jgi:hypothetical protein
MEQLKLSQHPKYKNYQSDNNGNIYFFCKKQKLTKNIKGYLCFRIKGIGRSSPQFLVHRFIMECYFNRDLKTKEYIDHINRKKDDNKIKNLRITTNSENLLNHKRKVGVTWDKTRNKFYVKKTIIGTGKGKFIGRFESEEEARTAYDNFKTFTTT